jgi:hypothetical protein
MIVKYQINKKHYRGTFNLSCLSNISCDHSKVLSIVKKNVRLKSNINITNTCSNQLIRNNKRLFYNTKNFVFSIHTYRPSALKYTKFKGYARKPVDSFLSRSFSSSCSIKTQYNARGVLINNNSSNYYNKSYLNEKSYKKRFNSKNKGNLKNSFLNFYKKSISQERNNYANKYNQDGQNIKFHNRLYLEQYGNKTKSLRMPKYKQKLVFKNKLYKNNLNSLFKNHTQKSQVRILNKIFYAADFLRAQGYKKNNKNLNKYKKEEVFLFKMFRFKIYLALWYLINRSKILRNEIIQIFTNFRATPVNTTKITQNLVKNIKKNLNLWRSIKNIHKKRVKRIFNFVRRLKYQINKNKNYVIKKKTTPATIQNKLIIYRSLIQKKNLNKKINVKQPDYFDYIDILFKNKLKIKKALNLKRKKFNISFLNTHYRSTSLPNLNPMANTDLKNIKFKLYTCIVSKNSKKKFFTSTKTVKPTKYKFKGYNYINKINKKKEILIAYFLARLNNKPATMMRARSFNIRIKNNHAQKSNCVQIIADTSDKNKIINNLKKIINKRTDFLTHYSAHGLLRGNEVNRSRSKNKFKINRFARKNYEYIEFRKYLSEYYRITACLPHGFRQVNKNLTKKGIHTPLLGSSISNIINFLKKHYKLKYKQKLLNIRTEYLMGLDYSTNSFSLLEENVRLPQNIDKATTENFNNNAVEKGVYNNIFDLQHVIKIYNHNRKKRSKIIYLKNNIVKNIVQTEVNTLDYGLPFKVSIFNRALTACIQYQKNNHFIKAGYYNNLEKDFTIKFNTNVDNVDGSKKESDKININKTVKIVRDDLIFTRLKYNKSLIKILSKKHSPKNHKDFYTEIFNNWKLVLKSKE